MEQKEMDLSESCRMIYCNYITSTVLAPQAYIFRFYAIQVKEFVGYHRKYGWLDGWLVG